MQEKIREYEEETKELLNDYSFQQRYEWINDQKNSGNVAFKAGNLDDAS